MSQTIQKVNDNNLSLPFNYSPREYQLPLFQALDNGATRVAQVWHRRAGKDKCDFNYMAKRAFTEIGQYFYVFPTYAQGKKALWDNRDNDGFRIIDHIPEKLRYSINNTDMKITMIHPFERESKGDFKPGSIIQIVGSEKVDSLVGSNPRGIVFSEYSIIDPIVWDYIRPILLANGGWVIFNFTPRGKNHAYELYKIYKAKMENKSSRYFADLLTVDDTGFLDKRDLEEERAEIINKNGDDSIFQQEYYCSFTASVMGSYYQDQLKLAESEGRIRDLEYDPSLPVYTYWDIGVSDYTCICFVQVYGTEVRFIDYYENSGKGYGFYDEIIKRRGYRKYEHTGPHDMDSREFSTGKTTLEIAADEYGTRFNIQPAIRVQDGIQAVREIFKYCHFDKVKCKRLLDCLSNYHKEYDEDRKMFKDNPEHDWSSHGADAMRYAAIGLNVQIKEKKKTHEEIMDDIYINQGEYLYRQAFSKNEESNEEDTLALFR